MPEFVVTLRAGWRVDVEADTYLRTDRAELTHEFIVGSGVVIPVMTYPDSRVACVQRRDGHLLEQLWPAT